MLLDLAPIIVWNLNHKPILKAFFEKINFEIASRENNGKYDIFYDFKLQASQQYSSDAVQFRSANDKFLTQIKSDPIFRKDMLRRYPQLAQWLKTGDLSKSPTGLTWHHHEDTRRLVLVDRKDHSKNHKLYHPTGKGGRDIWGGGSDGRRGKLDGTTGTRKCR